MYWGNHIAPLFFMMIDRKLIIFDLDGTIVDSLDDLTVSVNHMLGSFGHPLLRREGVRSLVGQGALKLVERAMPGAEPDVIRKALEIFLEYNARHLIDATAPYPDVDSTLRKLQCFGHTMVVVTNKNESLSRQLLAALGLDGFFREIYGADTLPSRKPSPEPLLHVMGVLGFSKDKTLMVGDSINDISAGNAAGVVTIGCSWGYGNIDELENADWRIDKFSDLLYLPPLDENAK